MKFIEWLKKNNKKLLNMPFKEDATTTADVASFQLPIGGMVRRTKPEEYFVGGRLFKNKSRKKYK